jgi:Cu(I)/Ag(I) efflux system membrane fusion protein
VNGRILLCTALLAVPLLTNACSPPSPKDGKEEKVSKAKVVWTCSMHPQIRQDHPGSCPICGMALVQLHSHDDGVTNAAESSPSPIAAAMEAPTPAASSPVGMNPLSESVIHLDEARSSVASIQTSSVESRAVQRKIDLFGEIAYIPDRNVDFTWYYGGRVEKVLVNFNTTEVQSGEPILQVYSDEAVADQRAYLGVLRDRWQSTFYQRKLYDTQLASIAERLMRVGMSGDEFRELERKGRVQYEFTIRAPRSGSILGSLPSVGERFTPDKVLFQIAPLDEVWFVADVYEQDLGLLRLGQQITLKCPAHPDAIFKGTLVYIDRQVDPQKRTIKARFLVSNSKRLLLPQLSATGLLQLGTQTSLLAIPSSSVIDTGKRQIVYVESAPHTYELRPVTIGPEGEIPSEGSTRWVPVLKGLESGEKVVSSGAFLIDAEAQMQGISASNATNNGTNTPSH